jgi:hypothetical protein
MEDGCPTFFGKYRGTVANAIDPRGIGRIQVSVPDVLGAGKLAWAMPCAPYAGKNLGFYAVPPRDAHVWVEFERGDPDCPIWTGCFWGDGEGPAGLGPLAALKTVLKTDKFNLEIDNNPLAPSLKLEVQLGGVMGAASIEAGPGGLAIKCAGNRLEFGLDGIGINNPNLKVLK